MIIYIGEFIGTALFILVGLGASCHAYYYPEEKKLNRLVLMSIGWSIAYVIPVLAFGEGNGPHLNPGITLALAYFELFDIRFVLGYVICQVAGALAGCIIFYICFFGKINDVRDAERQLKMFCVWPEEKNVVLNFIKEFVASFVWLFGLLGISQVYGIRTEVMYIFYVIIFVGVGFAFDLSSVALNPIRDVIPRLFHLIMPMKEKGKNHFWYIIITIIAPIAGCFLAVYLNQILPWDSAISRG